MSKIKPILFNTEMVKAILNGEKTMTRRIVRPQPPATTVVRHRADSWDWTFWADNDCGHPMRQPYKPGDILWVRETWRKTGVLIQPYAYRADEDRLHLVGEDGQRLSVMYRWRPSIHMPKEAARLFLRVTEIRAERLQDITSNDCAKEGVEREAISAVGEEFARGIFSDIWDNTVKPTDAPCYGWKANPWVWVIEFERVGHTEQGGEADGAEGQNQKILLQLPI